VVSCNEHVKSCLWSQTDCRSALSGRKNNKHYQNCLDSDISVSLSLFFAHWRGEIHRTCCLRTIPQRYQEWNPTLRFWKLQTFHFWVGIQQHSLDQYLQQFFKRAPVSVYQKHQVSHYILLSYRHYNHYRISLAGLILFYQLVYFCFDVFIADLL